MFLSLIVEILLNFDKMLSNQMTENLILGKREELMIYYEKAQTYVLPDSWLLFDTSLFGVRGPPEDMHNKDYFKKKSIHPWLQIERLQPSQPSLHRKIRAERYLCTRLQFSPASNTNCAFIIYSLWCLLTKIFQGLLDGQIFLLWMSHLGAILTSKILRVLQNIKGRPTQKIKMRILQ